ncbi:MAG TPA: hypothetical protein IAC16_03335, partial [Candidatus Limadaptatus stercoravium]|nr:hypothetical protein [Candidatus Limadaptatus stercoravium]
MRINACVHPGQELNQALRRKEITMKITMVKERKQKPDFTKLGFGKYFTDHMLVM